MSSFDAFLEHPQLRLLHIFGPGGIGKSALVQQLMGRTPADKPVLYLSASDLGTRPADIVDAVSAHGDASVWFIDGLEHWRVLDGWLRHEFFPAVPSAVRVVTSGRLRLSAEWKQDAGWADLARELELGFLNREDSERLLRANGAPVESIDELFRSTRGSPLLLLLGAVGRWGASLDERDDPVPALVQRLIEATETAGQQDALFLSALAPWTDDAILSTVCQPAAALTMLRWLGSQPGFLHSERGVAPHERVREALKSFANEHAPSRLRALSRGAQRRLVQRIAVEREGMRSMRDLTFVLKNEPGALAFGFSHQDSSYPSVLRPEDHSVFVEASRRFEGDLSASRTSRWLERYPDAFVVARGADGEALGYTFTPLCDDLHPDDLDEPGFAALIEWLEQWVATGAKGVFAMRSWLTLESHYGTSAAQGCLSAAHWRRTALSSGVVAVSGPDPSPFVEVWNLFADRAGPTFGEAPHQQRWWAHDRRETTPAEWLERVCGIVRASSDDMGRSHRVANEAEVRSGVLTVETVQPVMREVLRRFRDESSLGRSPLCDWLGVAGESGPKRAETVRAFVERLVAEMGDEGMDEERARVLRTTFLSGRKTQVEAADALAMSLATYRRRLSTALVQVSEHAVVALGR